jgi:hypothetical protein
MRLLLDTHLFLWYIDADIGADERFVAELRAKASPSRLLEKLAALRGKADPVPPG